MVLTVGGRVIEVRLVQGGERLLEAETIFINAGARPRHPDIVGLDEVEVLDSTSIMELDEVPDHLIVLGGGYIAVEFGQLFRRLGAEVTIVQRRDQLLPRRGYRRRRGDRRGSPGRRREVGIGRRSGRRSRRRRTEAWS